MFITVQHSNGSSLQQVSICSTDEFQISLFSLTKFPNDILLYSLSLDQQQCGITI